MSNNNKPVPDLPQQFTNLSQLVGMLGQTMVAAEGMCPEGKERLYGLFDVVVGGLSSYIDKEFPSSYRTDNVLSLVNTPIEVSTAPSTSDDEVIIDVSGSEGPETA